MDVNIVAHQDDDILFMNPDILNSVVAGHRQVTVYITAGNIGRSTDLNYSLAREEGAIAGYSKLLQLADLTIKNAAYFSDFTDIFHGDSIFPAGCYDTCFPCAAHDCDLKTAGDDRGQRITLQIPNSRLLNAATIGDGPDGPRVTLIFLRVDSPCTVDNTPLPFCSPPTTLAQLFQTTDPDLEIASPFGQPGYTRNQLKQQLARILQYYQPDVVRTQDPADGHTAIDYYLGSTTTTVGFDSDGQHLGADPNNPITINVNSTADFPSSGVVDIDAVQGHNGVDYTGTTPFTLTGCSGGSSSSIIHDGDVVTLAYHGEKIARLDCFGGTNFYDHTDHVWGARFAREALSVYDRLNAKKPAHYYTYYAYNVEWNQNVADRVDPSDQPAKNFCLKKSMFYRYALHDAYASLVAPTCDGFAGYSYENIGYQKFDDRPLP